MKMQQEGTKDICMCFKSDKKHRYETASNRAILEFHTTRFSVIIPIFVSLLAFVAELYSAAHSIEGDVSCLYIFRLLNTTFIPTHIATTTVFLYQHFSLSNYYNQVGRVRPIDDTELKAENAGLTIGSTVILAFFYALFSREVTTENQFFLFVMQCFYMLILWKFSIKDRIIIYEKPIKNVVSY